MHSKVRIAIMTLVALLVLNACGGTETISVEEILSNASDTLLNATSVQFAIEREGEPPVVDPGTGSKFISMTGFYQAPDTVQATIRAETPFGVQDLGLVWSPEGNSLTIPGLGTTDLGDDFGFSAVDVFHAEGLPTVLTSALVDPTLEGEENGNYHISATASGESIASITAGVVVSEDMAVDLYVNTETFEIANVVLTESSGDRWLVDLFGYNEPPEG